MESPVSTCLSLRRELSAIEELDRRNSTHMKGNPHYSSLKCSEGTLVHLATRLFSFFDSHFWWKHSNSQRVAYFASEKCSRITVGLLGHAHCQRQCHPTSLHILFTWWDDVILTLYLKQLPQHWLHIPAHSLMRRDFSFKGQCGNMQHWQLMSQCHKICVTRTTPWRIGKIIPAAAFVSHWIQSSYTRKYLECVHLWRADKTLSYLQYSLHIYLQCFKCVL